MTVIQNEFYPLYIVDPIYFPSIESANLTTPEGTAEEIAFGGMADQEGHEEHKGDDSDEPSEVSRHWHHLHRCAVGWHAHPVHEVRRLAWDDHDIDNTNGELWTFMEQMEWDYLAPHELDWRANWYEVSLELRDN